MGGVRQAGGVRSGKVIGWWSESVADAWSLKGTACGWSQERITGLWSQERAGQ